jgi:hypothetical protein
VVRIGIGGGSAIYAGSPLQRRFRDVHAIIQRFLVKLDTFTTARPYSRAADLTVFWAAPLSVVPAATKHGL